MRYIALETKLVRHWQAGGPDAYGLAPEEAISDGAGTPCRHCLQDIPKGAPMLILAHRPFADLQPYAETGPIFVCAEACLRGDTDELPHILSTSASYLIKGYDNTDRIIYGTGRIVAAGDIRTECAGLLADPKIAYLHVRSARNNCYQLRIDR